MRILWHLIQIRKDELDVVPVLHCHRIQLVRNDHFHGGKEICISVTSELETERVEVGALLFLLNRDPKTERTRNDNVTAVEV